MDDAAVKAKLYTKESMTCDGSKEVPDDPEPSSDKDDTDSDTQPGDDDSGDTGKDNGSSDPADGEDEEDDAGCALIFI